MPSTNSVPTDPATEAQPMLHEADIGSGERNAGQEETDRIVADIPKLPDADGQNKDKESQAADRQ